MVPCSLHQLRPLESDRFVWRWSADGQYSVRSAYRAYFIGWTRMAGAKELWRAAVTPKVKFFFWLALHGRIGTADRRRRHGLQADAACALCDQMDETTDHLLPRGMVTAAALTWILPSRPFSDGQPPQALRRSFDSLVLLVSWACVERKESPHLRPEVSDAHRAAT